MGTLLSDEEFVRLWDKHRSMTEMARATGMDLRGLHRRRRRVEASLNIVIARKALSKSARYETPVKDGIEIIFSDAHYWPGDASTAHRALRLFIQNFHPIRVINNGDAFDGAGISRHPPIGWEGVPSVQEQIEVTQERLGEIEEDAGGAELVWTLGNHDARFETYLASKVGEYRRVEGFHLQDKFPNWIPAWSAFVGDQLVVKHRFKGGLHAAFNNTLWSGRSIATGHDHMLSVRMLTDYNGMRYGVQTGTISQGDIPGGVESGAFVDYTEDNPLNWQRGFVINTYKGGRLLVPEIAVVTGPGEVVFRGEVIRV